MQGAILYDIEQNIKRIAKEIYPYINEYMIYTNTPKSNVIFDHSLSAECGLLIQYRCDYNEFVPSKHHIKMAYIDEVEGLKVIDFKSENLGEIIYGIKNIIQNNLLF